MSFSGEVKEEMVKLGNMARHCQIAELAAMLVYEGRGAAAAQQDTPYTTRRCQELIGQIFQGQNTDMLPSEKILQTVKYTAGDMLVNPLVMKSICCKRAYLRGAFLAVGSISNPQKSYHLEFVCADHRQAEQLIDVLAVFGIHAKTVTRKKYQVVYIKESEEIVDLLNVMGAHKSLMNLENLRILKEVRNSVNRQVNCEAANITKTVNAAAKQIADIQYLKDHYGFDNLPHTLREIAQIRLDYPDATLKELGTYLTPAVGKSGVNHRLRKLSELAKDRRI